MATQDTLYCLNERFINLGVAILTLRRAGRQASSKLIAEYNWTKLQIKMIKEAGIRRQASTVSKLELYAA